jgi:hypothetical protein
MRFYTRQHLHYCGIDLHAHQKGKTLVHRKLPCNRDQLLKTLAPYRKDLAVACRYSLGSATDPAATPVLRLSSCIPGILRTRGCKGSCHLSKATLWILDSDDCLLTQREILDTFMHY